MSRHPHRGYETTRSPDGHHHHRSLIGALALSVFATSVLLTGSVARPLTAAAWTGTGTPDNGATVPPLFIDLFDRDTAPDIVRTVEATGRGDSPLVFDITYGQIVGRWSPGVVAPASAGHNTPLGGPYGDPYLFPDTDPALNAGARVHLSSEATSSAVTLTPITHRFKRAGSTITLSDGGVLPGPGFYMLFAHARYEHTMEEWRTMLWIRSPGAFQVLWFNDGFGQHGEPFIAFAVNGAYVKGGFLRATGIRSGGDPYPFPDSITAPGKTLTVVSGVPISFVNPGYGTLKDYARLSYGSLTKPYVKIASIPLTGPDRVISAPPGDYLFRVYASFPHQFSGFRVCRIHVVARPPA
ncbi:MAG: hypothetical protein QOG88_947 [Actinomycetota bacterium]|nr:hypothetical protein [Actinomycetota bacterium]